MAYRYTLPAQPSPYTCQQRELALRSQTISNAIASPTGRKRASLYSRAPPKDYLPQQQPRIDLVDKENVRITTYPVSAKTALRVDTIPYDPADPTTWGVKPLPPLPLDEDSPPMDAGSIHSKADDDCPMLQSPIMPPCSEANEKSHNLAKLIGDHLRIDDDQPTHASHHRTTSSSYHGPESEPSRVQSPIPNAHGNVLNVSDIAKYGKANDRLSNLRSGSPSSATGDLLLQDDYGSSDNGPATGAWQKEPYVYERQISRYRFASSPSEGTASNVHGNGFDGADETIISSQPTIAPSPPASVGAQHSLRRAKRQASHFSLRSLGKPFSKRPRLGFRKWANSVFHESGRRLRVAKRKIKEHAGMERRQFTTWKSQRRNGKAVDS